MEMRMLTVLQGLTLSIGIALLSVVVWKACLWWRRREKGKEMEHRAQNLGAVCFDVVWGLCTPEQYRNGGVVFRLDQEKLFQLKRMIVFNGTGIGLSEVDSELADRVLGILVPKRDQKVFRVADGDFSRAMAQLLPPIYKP